MKIFRYVLLLLIGWVLGCGSSPPADPRRQLSNALLERFATGDTLPSTPETLEAFFPAAWDGWQVQGEMRFQTAQGPTPFLTADRQYRQSDGWTYLGVSVADYAADSTALLRLYQSWPEVSYLRGLPDPRCSLEASVLTQLPATGATRLEFICQARYLVSLQTNHPEGERLLVQLLPRLRWEQIMENL